MAFVFLEKMLIQFEYIIKQALQEARYFKESMRVVPEDHLFFLGKKTIKSKHYDA